jgi:hypothetical protein
MPQNLQNNLPQVLPQEDHLQIILPLPGLLDEFGALTEETFNALAPNVSDDLDSAQWGLVNSQLLDDLQEERLNHICADLARSLVSWPEFQNGWQVNRLELINFMLATPAFQQVHQQLLDEDL